jgi:hypothetical protein
MKIDGEVRVFFHTFLTSALDRPVATLLPETDLLVPRRLGGVKARMDTVVKRKIFRPCQGSNPNASVNQSIA